MRTLRWLIPAMLLLNASAQTAIRLRSGPLPGNLMNRGLAQARIMAEESAERIHLLARFEKRVDDEVKRELEARGIRLVSFVPGDAYVISTPSIGSLEGTGVIYAGMLEAANKLGPSIEMDDPAREESVVAEFHYDVELGRGRALARKYGLEVVENPDLLPHQLMVRGPLSAIQSLVRLDPVASVYKASGEMVRGEPVTACAGPVAGALPLAASLVKSFGEGWDGPGRNAAEVGYWLGVMTRSLPESDTRAQLFKAMKQWASAGAITFRGLAWANQRQAIDIFFAAGDHGDGFKFDGPGRVLAHTFYPPPNAETIAGDLHFDADEPWKIGTDTDVSSVALHELGHALGLGHSDNPNDVMYAFYRRWTGLQAGDIEAIRTLYADPPADVPETPATPADPQTPASPGEPEPPNEPETPEIPAQPSPDATAPSLSLTSPARTSVLTTASSIVMRGTATDNVGVTLVSWTTSMGGSGTAAGLPAWKTGPIPLVKGTNQVVIRAYDAAGNSAWRSVAVTRR